MSNVDAPEAQASRCYFSLPHLNSEYTAHQPPEPDPGGQRTDRHSTAPRPAQ